MKFNNANIFKTLPVWIWYLFLTLEVQEVEAYESFCALNNQGQFWQNKELHPSSQEKMHEGQEEIPKNTTTVLMPV